MVTKTYVIEDCLKVISSQTVTATSTGVVFTKLYGLSSEIPVEVSCDIKSSKTVKFGLVLKEGDNQTNNQYIRVGAESPNKGATITSTQYTQTNNLTTSATANTSFPVKITYDGTDITGYVDGNSVISHSKTFSPLYVMIIHWSENSRTVTVSNLKVKPL